MIFLMRKKAKITRKTLEKRFPPEFLNRIDDIIVFRALTKEDNLQILSILLNEIAGRVESLSMKLEYTDEVKNFLVDKGTDLKYGARPLRRTAQRYIENPLAELILKGECGKLDHLLAEMGKDEDGEDTVIFNKVGQVELQEEEKENGEENDKDSPKSRPEAKEGSPENN